MKTGCDTSVFVKNSLNLVRINIPFLAELADNIELAASNKIETAGIFASGRLIYNPEWIEKLNLTEATFVIAHEIMHLALNTHSRGKFSENDFFNISHDFIINEMLKKTLSFEYTPAGGLDWSLSTRGYYNTIEGKSAEEILGFIKDLFNREEFRENIFKGHWKANIEQSWDKLTLNLPLADKLKGLLKENTDKQNVYIKTNTDVLTTELELELFPEASNEIITAQKAEIKNHISKALSRKLIIEKAGDFFSINQRGGNSQTYNLNYEVLKGLYQPPWELALQQWLEGNIITQRNYSKPSRRGYFSSCDIVLPGKVRFGYTLHVILDVSGSQSQIQPYALGKISAFCEEMQIEQIHIIQCGTHITKDEWVYSNELKAYPIIGTGGGDMRPAMNKLIENSEVDCVVIITDGYEEILVDKPPYEVLWVLTIPNTHFNPSYGIVIQID